ncbi:MAG: type II secretion system secretin GspD [Burkholderiales bacterium]|nr:type II secretion system secretin GspD [Burkholderiales bacterium]
MIFEPLKRHVSSAGFLTVLVFMLTSCVPASKDAPVEVDAGTAEVIKSSGVPYSQALAETVDRVKTGSEDDDRIKVFKGSGVMVKGQTPWESVPPVTVTPPDRSAAPTSPPAAAAPMTPSPEAQSETGATPQRTPTTRRDRRAAQTAAQLAAATPAPSADSATSPAATPASEAKSETDATPQRTPTTRRSRSAAQPAAPASPADSSAAQPTPAPATTTQPAPTDSSAAPAETPATPPTTASRRAAASTPSAPPPAAPSARSGGNIVLNFEAADLREVIRNILGDILGEAYLIDPTVNGQVTIRTSSGIPRESLYATLETLLRMNNATMTKEEGIYKILPAAVGFKGSVTPQLGSSQRPLPKGFSVQIVPLRYVSAKEMLKILEPFAKDAQATRTDDVRNLMILSGTELELRHLLDTIEMFDIDWMSGMSVGLFKLKNVDVKNLSQDLQSAIGGDSGMGLMLGAMKFIPIERMNMLLVVTPQPDQLDEVKKWIERFDEEDNMETPRLYVYALKYARADRLAPLLQQAFTGKNTGPTRIQPATTAPGTTGVTMGGARTGAAGTGAARTPTTTTGARQQQQQTQTTAALRQQQAQIAARPGMVARPGMPGAAGGMGIAQDIQVVADEDNNAILIVATPSEYTLVEQALKQLDVPQRQVVIEVTMAEVTLSDSMKFGTKWWFTSNSGNTFGGTDSPPFDLSGGFSLILNRSQFNAFLTATDGTNNVNLVANPHIAALDNQEATISITQQIPYRVTSFSGGVSDYRSEDWRYATPGVTVRVKPRINDGGNVSMEADIEFSALSGPPPSDGSAPALMSRNVSSQLMVPSGSTMVIGGLIRDDKTSGTDGVPFLSRVPVLGALFGEQSWTSARTELIIFLTPRVVDNDEDRRAVIQDLRHRMDNLEGLLQDSKALPTDLLRREILLEELDEMHEEESEDQ